MEKSQPRILIVDDEVIIAAEMLTLLDNAGYHVVGTASSGKEGIEKAKSLRPDLILMDIVMPGDIDGILASAIIRERYNIPVVFMTAYGGESVLKRVKETAPYGFILKPFQQHELKATIEVAFMRRDMETKLQESEEKYRAVVDTTSDAIITMDRDKTIVFINYAVEKCFGYLTDEIIGKSIDFLLQTESLPELFSDLDEIVETGSSDILNQTLEIVGVRKSEESFPLEFSLATWKVKDEVFITITGRDIAERKKIDQMKSNFVSLVSHQLKTPVAGIMGCIDNMMQGLTGNLSFKQLEYLQVMRDISTREYQIISNLLNVSRIERGVVHIDIGPVSLKSIADRAIHEHKNVIENKGLYLRLNSETGDYIVEADQDKLFEAVSNVVHNAFKFTETGGITLNILKNQMSGIIEVSDTGIGIATEDIKYLFKKDRILFGAPTAKGGCGLGLFIAKEFLNCQNGEIYVNSIAGEGTTFQFYVPLKQDQ